MQAQLGLGRPDKEIEYATKGRLNIDTGEYSQDPHWVVERQIIAGCGFTVDEWVQYGEPALTFPDAVQAEHWERLLRMSPSPPITVGIDPATGPDMSVQWRQCRCGVMLFEGEHHDCGWKEEKPE